MKHFIRTAFWIFTLFGCLLAIPRRLMETALADSDFDVDELIENVKCEPDSTFYIKKHVQPECITAALNCIHQEFNGTVRTECKDDEGVIDNTLYFLKTKIENRVEAGHILNSSTECACELGSEVSFPDFVNRVKTLLENIKQRANMS